MNALIVSRLGKRNNQPLDAAAIVRTIIASIISSFLLILNLITNVVHPNIMFSIINKLSINDANYFHLFPIVTFLECSSDNIRNVSRILWIQRIH